MKKNLFALFIALLSVGQVFGHTTDHYGKIVATTMGNGTVYLSTSSESQTDGEESGDTADESVEKTWNCNENADNDSKTFYAFATASKGYYFAGWSKSETSNDNTSSENPYAATHKATGTAQNSPSSLYIYAYFEANPAVSVTFAYPDAARGTLEYTNNGTTKTIAEQTVVETNYAFDLTATPQQNYKFLRWWKSTNNGVTKVNLGFDAQLTNISFLEDCMVGIEFIPATTPVFIVKGGDGTMYTDLNEACAAAEKVSGKTVVLFSDGTLPAGNYTIPQGVTLLIPYDNSDRMGKWSNTSDITLPQAWHGHADRQGNYKKEIETSYSTDGSFPYVTLKMAKDATIVVNGTLYLNAARWTTNDSGNHGKNYGTPSISGDYRIDQGYGLIDMEEGSSIEIGQTGKLYCWGRIRGEGTIEANNGAEVRECFVFTDHRESDAFACIAQNTKCFPMNQYYIQDIQVPITFNYGAKEILVSGIFSTSKSPVYDGTMNFIGANTDNNSSLIEIASNGSVTKQYNVIKDRLEFRFSNASFNNTYLSVTGFGTQSSTETHVFTITNNWTINVESDTTHIAHDIALAAGAELNISSGASVVVDKGASLYVMDKEDWGLFACHRKIIPLFLPSYEKEHFDYAGNGVTFVNKTWGNTSYDAIRTPDNLTSASIKVDGSLIVKGGTNTIYDSPKFGGELGDDKEQRKSGLYTSNNGAKIYSENDGIVIYEDGSGTQYSVPQLWGTGRGTDADWGPKCDSAQVIYVRVTPAQLKNADSSYTQTKDFTSETTFVYENGTWIAKIETIDIEEATYTVPSGNKIEATDITIHEGAAIEIAENASVETQTLALSTTPSAINLPDEGQSAIGTSSQIKGNGTITAQNVYIDITMDTSGTLDASKYYAFAVPFAVNVDGGVQQFNDNEWVDCKHDTHYRAYTYDGAKRADNGKGSNWTLVDNNGTFQPGVFYLVEFAPGMGNVYRFTKAEGNLNNAADINLKAFASANTTDKGWNGIANNALQNVSISLSGTGVAQIFNPVKNTFVTIELDNTQFAIGTPLFVQTDGEGTATNSAVSQSTSAPAQMLAQPQTETLGNYIVRIAAENADKMADQLFISASEDAENNYVIGKDLVKMFMGNATTAQLWVNNYDKKLSMHQALLTNGSAEASLTLFAPKAGNYRIYLKEAPEDATIYLLENGYVVANLNDDAYYVALTKGENSLYGLRINAKTKADVTTSINDIKTTNSVQKVLFQNKVYIVRNGRLFNTLGQPVK